jgi:hypothetical protein
MRPEMVRTPAPRRSPRGDVEGERTRFEILEQMLDPVREPATFANPIEAAIP